MGFTYQASDLSQKRRAFIDEARSGVARLRDTDGMSLVMISEERYETLEQLALWTHRHLAFERALRIPTAERRVADLGDLTWLRAFDEDDLLEFRGELEEALHVAIAERSLVPVNRVVAAWRTTARSLDDPVRREILLGAPKDDDFVEVDSPTPAADNA